MKQQHVQMQIPAILDEYESLIQNSTWTLSPLPPGRSAIKGKWIFTFKTLQSSCPTIQSPFCSQGLLSSLRPWLCRHFFASCETLFATHRTGYCCGQRSRNDATWHQDGVPQWWPSRGNLYGAARRIHHSGQGDSSMQVEERIGPEAGITGMQSEISRIHCQVWHNPK